MLGGALPVEHVSNSPGRNVLRQGHNQVTPQVINGRQGRVLSEQFCQLPVVQTADETAINANSLQM